jgi:hypothetical protein
MNAPSPRLLIGAANVFVGVGELSRDDRGPVVDMMLRQVGMPADGGWSTAFVHHVGYWSHFDHATRTSSWPLPALGDANALAQFGREQRIEREQPEPFDLFALYSPARAAFVRSGIILTVGESNILPDGARYHECITLEGDTNGTVGMRGRATRRAKRFLSHGAGDRFLRWTDLPLCTTPCPEPPDTLLTVATGVLRRRAA